MAGKFTRFSEKRDTVISDVTTYDDAVDGIEPDESAGLHIPITKDNVGFKLIQKMGWTSGCGLGRNKQGRIDPVPLKLKDDYMGLGRFERELELAVEATEKRKQMEIEKELTPGLIHKYKSQMDKEKSIAESTSELRQSYFCELCDKQYNKYSEYDNHLNSYDHHHRQRLKNLKEYEVGRKFGGHRANERDPKKMAAAQMIALERAEIKVERHLQKTSSPSFKPMGYRHSKATSTSSSSTSVGSESVDASSLAITSALRKRSSEVVMESEKKIAEKKARLEKFGVKFQSAGHLATINENNTKEGTTLSSYQMIIFNSKDSSSQDEQSQTSTTADSKKTGLYGGRFVPTSSNANEDTKSKEEEKQRNERLSSLPQAKGRLSEQLTAVELAGASDDDDDDEEFVFGRKKIAQFGKPKVKPPVKQMSLKLTDKYDSYYH